MEKSSSVFGAHCPRIVRAPLHIHHLEDEEGLVTDGTLSAVVGGQHVTAGPGQTVRLPRGVRHRWWNAGDQPLAFEGSTRPAVDLDRYLQAVFEVMNAVHRTGRRCSTLHTSPCVIVERKPFWSRRQ
jgi:uncharacterized cupin superfamily protein